MDRTDKRWSQRVTETSNALDLEPGVFALEDPQAIAASLKVSADRSERRKSPPFASAMRMLTFYINRAGRTLSADQRAVLEQAKIELRILYGKMPEANGLASQALSKRAWSALAVRAGPSDAKGDRKVNDRRSRGRS
jgi:hypothetical protein